MLSPADSVIVFVIALLIIFVIFFTVLFVNSARSRARTTRGNRLQTGVEVPAEQIAAVNRLDPSASTPKGTDPRGVDIGSNYN